MKKLILLLVLAVVMAGFAFAVHPPGDINPEMILAEFSVQQDVVTQPTVLTTDLLPVEQPVSVDRYTKYTELIIFWGEQYLSGELSKDEYANLVTAAIYLLRLTKYNDTGQVGAVSTAGDYYLRC
jgi:hypothetical protein